jgi:uncharacterized protein (TIGR02594 family)
MTSSNKSLSAHKAIAGAGGVVGAVVQSEDAMTKWLERLEMYERQGFKEVPGPGSNDHILKWAHGAGKSTWVKSDATPWCGIGLAGIFDECGLGHVIPPEPARAISWAKCGVECEPMVGAILVFKRDGGHHVTVIKKIHGDVVDCLGCNQGDAIKTSPYRLSEALYCRWPIREDIPTDSRIYNAAQRQKRDQAKAGGTLTTGPVSDAVPSAASKSVRHSVDSVFTDIGWVKSIAMNVTDFASFVGARWWWVAIAVAGYFLARNLWDSYVIANARREDHQQGYTT